MKRIVALVALALFVVACGRSEFVNNDELNDPDYETIVSENKDANSAAQTPAANLLRSYVVNSFHVSNITVSHPSHEAGVFAAESSVYYEYHPIEIHFGVTAIGNPFETHIMFGLMEKLATETPTEEDYAELNNCVLGSTIIEHGGGTEAREMHYSAKFMVPGDCLADGAGEVEKTFNVWVSVDTEGEVLEDGEEPDDGTVLIYSAIESSGERNQLCLDSAGAPGCVYDLTVKPTHGINVSIDGFDLPSSVAILSANTTDHPDAVDAGDNRLDEHNEPFLQVNTHVTLEGADGISDDATDPLANETVTLSYSICPGADSQSHGDHEDSCAGGSNWLPLTIYDPANPGSHDEHFESETLTDLIPGRIHSYTHFLYAEGETRQRLAGGGEWEDYTLFAVRACVDVDDYEEKSVASDTDYDTTDTDNCKFSHVTVANPISNDHSANTYSFNRGWEKTYGSTKTVGAKIDFNTNNTLNLSGAVSKTEGNLSTTGWLKKNVVHAHADAGAYVSLVGSYIDVQQKIIGVTLFSYQKTVEEIEYTRDWELAKEACGNFRYGVLVLTLNVSVCASGSAGFTSSFTISTATGNDDVFSDAQRIGEITANFTPGTSFDMSASAYVSVAVARGGVEGDLTLVEASLPVTAVLNWGLTQLAPPILSFVGNVDMNLTIDTLNGKFILFADTRGVNWCSKKFKIWGKKIKIKYPCGFKWNRQVNINLFSWSGKSYEFDLLSRRKVLTLQ